MSVKTETAAPKPLVTGADGLRHARHMIASLLQEMADDPLTRRSQSPYNRGQRDALNVLDGRIKSLLKVGV